MFLVVLYVCPSYRCCVDSHFTLLLYVRVFTMQLASNLPCYCLSVCLSIDTTCPIENSFYRPHDFVCTISL